MTKTYRSASVISFSVTYPNGNYKRIRFTPYSWGGSIYVTDNKEEQELIEKNKDFGLSFRLESATGDEEPADKEIAVAEEVAETIKVEVNDIDEAKDYLVENYNMLRSKLRSTVAIKAAAADKGIEFVGI